MRIDWKNVLALLGLIIVCLVVCAVLWTCVWVDSEVWLHVSPLMSWILAIGEIFIAIVCFSLRKKK